MLRLPNAKIRADKDQTPNDNKRTPARPFSKISIDFVGPKEPTSAGNQYILTIQDNFSKYCELVPVRQATAEEFTRALTEKRICYSGSSVTLISDQRPHFYEPDIGKVRADL